MLEEPPTGAAANALLLVSEGARKAVVAIIARSTSDAEKEAARAEEEKEPPKKPEREEAPSALPLGKKPKVAEKEGMPPPLLPEARVRDGSCASAEETGPTFILRDVERITRPPPPAALEDDAEGAVGGRDSSPSISMTPASVRGASAAAARTRSRYSCCRLAPASRVAAESRSALR